MDSPLIKEVSLFLDDKPSVYALREKAKKALFSTGFPTKKTESWKYTDVSEIINHSFQINEKEDICDKDCCHHNGSSEYFIEIHFCHGRLHIEEYNTPKGVTITPLPLALYEEEYKQYFFNSFDLNKHPFAALNGMYLEQGVCIIVDKDIKTPKPIIIKYNQTGCLNQQTNIHNLIVLKRNASLEFIESFSSGDNNTHLTNIVNEIYLKQNSELTHYKIQKENSSNFHVSLTATKQQDNSKYRQFYLSYGAKISRQETLINLEQQFSEAKVFDAYKAKTNCITDITTNVNHWVANTYSNQYAKAVLETNSTANFQGKILIQKDAVKTSGNQLHKALYLDNNANLNCKPELEIYADDVKCSHGATCGEINKEQLFYLTSRGIDQDTAKNILVQAHLDEIISLIPNEEIKKLFFF